MRVATWNVNNVNKRVEQLIDWLQRTQPDVVGLQELKCTTADFPTEVLKGAGYSSLVVGQKTWNGVALLSRDADPLPVTTNLPGDASDKQARYVEAAINGVLYACLYLPNGNPFPGPKFDYKMRWFARLQARAAELMASEHPVVMLGDWNVVPTDQDIYKPDTWRDNALLQPEPRRTFAQLLADGWTDALAPAKGKRPPFTFWDYRRKRWERDAGLRIDHILVNERLKIVGAGVDREERAHESPSDHAPVWADLSPARRSRARAGPTAPQPKAASPVNARKAKPTPAATDALATYQAKRDFSKTSEPSGATKARRSTKTSGHLRFVIQKHWASRLHYDFRLEMDGVMVSWALPKGPSFDPKKKSLAIHVEDHPLEYNTFEGTIPKGEYGAGTVIVWDRGFWKPVGDPRDGLRDGKIMFHLHGEKLAGLWELVRISKPGEKKQDQWMLFKKRGDAWARPHADYDVISALPDSVVTQPLGLVEAREPRGAPLPADRSSSAPRAGDADLRAAHKSPLFPLLEPQLATLVSAVPQGDYVIETKYDGYRMLIRIDGDDIKLLSRNGNDWSGKLRHLVNAIRDIGLTTAWLDGEIVVLNDAGLPDFNRLQNSFTGAKAKDITLFLFDVMYMGGMDLRAAPLTSRRSLLQQVVDVQSNPVIRFSEAFDVDPSQLLAAACQLGLEGLMAKRADSPYTPGRSTDWMKLKCQHRQEFAVVGFTTRSNASQQVGSLLLGYHEGGALRYAGSVGTGWDSRTAETLFALLEPLEANGSPVKEEIKPGRWSKRRTGSERWVKPQIVIEVAFSEWTPEKHVRHAVFRGLRTDKPASEIVRERPSAPPVRPDAATAPSKPARTLGVKVTHPDRVIDTASGLRKIDLVHYYESIAERILPHLKQRPVSLVRAPNGISGELFFQKHPEAKMPGLRALDTHLWPGHAALLEVHTPEALISAAQMNVIEFHTWNSKTTKIDQPDRFILDLDPGEGVPWTMRQEAAELTRVMLTELGLASWLKTSGGKGLHVVVPITPKHDYTVVKAFSQAVVKHMAKVIPSKFAAVMGPKNRVGKIFIDYLRNGHAQTTASAFSARARPGMGVSMPVAWEQLRELKSGSQWTVATAREYLSFQVTDPWADYWKKRQSIDRGMKLLG